MRSHLGPLPDETSSVVPARAGPWTLDVPLGSGGFGTVYRAHDGAGRVAAVKLLAAPPGDELRALARVHHPAVVTLLGAGQGPPPYLALSLAPGAPLPALPRLSPPEVHRIVAILADALAACHQAGVVHGDLKPANVVLDRVTGRPTLVDFGLSGQIGGTLAYAAPEILDGDAATPPSDVYSLGLLAYELATGDLPWPELEPTARLARRAGQAPPPPIAAPLRELLVEMLHPRPAARPSAEAVADRLEASGVPLFVPSGADLFRRASTLWIGRPSVDATVGLWIDRGGSLSVAGPPGSGRTQVLARAANELVARGRSVVTLGPGGGPWAAIEAALRDHALPGPPCELPEGADLLTRVDTAAEALLARADGPLRILVDDWDDLDPPSRDVVEAVVRQGAAALIAGTRGPGWVRDRTALAPLDPDGVAALVSGLLGAADPALVAQVGRWPGEVVAGVRAVVDSGVAVWRRRRWVVDADALDRLDLRPQGARRVEPQLGGLSAAAARLGAVVALAEPVARDEALRLAGVSEVALDELLAAGVVRGGAAVAVASPAVGLALVRAVPDRVGLCRELRDAWVRASPIPYPALARVLGGCEDPVSAALHGPACVRAVAERDVALSVQIADELWPWAEVSELAAARVEVLVRAGRAAEAREAGAAWLERSVDRAVVVALARLEDQVAEDPLAMLGWLDRLGDDPSPEVALTRARALFRAKRLPEAAAACRSVTDRTQPSRWLSAMTLLSQVEAELGSAESGLAVLGDVPEELGRGTAERALLDATRGRLLWHVGRARDAARAMESAAALRRALPIVERARLDNNAALVWYSAGDADRAVDGWERALLGFERIGAELEVVRVLVNLCQGFRDLGWWGRAEDAGRRALAAARAHGAAAFEAVALGNLGDCALWQRRFAQAQELYDLAEPVARAEGLGSELVELARRRAELALFRRDPDAVARASAAIQEAEAAGATAEAARAQALLAWARSGDGRIEPFRILADRAVDALRTLGATGELATARLALAEGWTALGRDREAMAQAELVAGYADEFGRPPLKAWADRILAHARRSMGPHSKLEALTALAVKVAMHTELDVILRELAGALVDLVDAERALVLLLDGGVPRIAASAGVPLETPPSRSIVNRVVSLGRPLVVTDLEERADLRAAESVVKMHLRAVHCVPLMDDGAMLGVLYLDSREQPIGAHHEATALVRALAAHASIALRNARQTAEIRRNAEMASEIAHDLRNPLSAITLMLSDVVGGGPPLEGDDAVQLLEAARHATDLVQQTLGSPRGEPTAVALSESVRRWLGPQRAQARRRGIEVALEADARGSVWANPGDLQRVLTNLTSNALKYSPPGGVVTIRTFDLDGRVGLEVTDQGPGIPPLELARIFDRGYQGAGALPGQGLGLAIVRRLVERAGGSVRATNRPEGGAAVTVQLPVHARNAGESG